jgi:hypothetical protein
MWSMREHMCVCVFGTRAGTEKTTQLTHKKEDIFKVYNINLNNIFLYIFVFQLRELNFID